MNNQNKLHKLIAGRIFWVIIIGILSVAVVTRLYKLGDIPGGITWDEAAIAYNGYAIVTARRDEWLIKLPLSFRSFGDYKAPLAIYLNGIFTFFLGLHPWSVRLPFALFGIAFIASLGWLIYELLYQSKFRNKAIILGMLMATFSPWHFHFSRIGFESGLAVTFITLGLACVLFTKRKFLNAQSAKLMIPSIVLLLGATSLILSMYAYHSAKIFVPLLLPFLLFMNWNWLKAHLKVLILLIVISGALIFPVYNDTLYGDGGTRSNVLIFSQKLSSADIIKTFSENFVKHFSLDFLVLGKVDSPRHGVGQSGILSWSSFILIIIGVILSIRSKNSVGKEEWSLFWLGILITVLGIIPAALSAETVPHSNRALLALPGLLMLAVFGAVTLMRVASNHSKLMLRMSIGLIIALESLLFLHFYRYYLSEYPAISTEAFQQGYVQAFTIARDYEKGINGKPEVDKVLVSTEYGQPYIYALFVKHPSPIAYQGGTLYKYEFSDNISMSDLERNNALVLATKSSNMDESKATEIIRGDDGSIRFMIFYTGVK